MQKPIYSIPTAAAIAGCSIRQTRRYLELFDIPVMRPRKGRIFVSRQGVEKLLKALKTYEPRAKKAS